ncbi:MAG: spermidine/putrescine ABC transporter substrate-binding protein [Ruminococcaceae bacterium]|nr:spermidine/putrescine ABC transporter substrate-binding protein [Oscillospiraceae bacterium]
MKKTISFIILIAVLLGVLSMSGCKSYEGEINVYNWGEFISDGSEGTLDVIAEFEDRYNIKVNYTTYETNEEMYDILKSTNSSYDIVIPSDYMIGKLIEKGLVQKINFDNVPNYKNIMDSYKNLPFDPNNEYCVPYSAGIVAIVYNKNMIQDNIDSYSAMWNEAYKGKILMIDNSRDAMAIAMLLKGITPDVVTKEDIDIATSYLKEQKPFLKKYAMDQTFPEMENNQAAIAAYYAGDIVSMMGNNENLTYALPKEGTNKFVDCMCIPTSSKNKELAEKFINYMLEAEIAKANAEYIGYSTPNKAAFELLDDEIKSNELSYPSEEYMNKCFYFSNLPDDVYEYMQEMYLQAKN